LILSGILGAQAAWVSERLRELGINNPCEVTEDGEWIALIV
jgi:hypothetical protein